MGNESVINKYEAIVFDMDGVIFDSERTVLECWMSLASAYRLENLEEAFMACTGTNAAKTKEIMLERYGQDFPYDEYSKKASVLFHEKYDGGKLPLKTGAEEILKFLKKNGTRIALASSTRKPVVVRELTDAGLVDYFDVIVGGDMVQNSKPAPDIFLMACSELTVNPENTIGIEDSFNGMRALGAAKMRPIMVPDLLQPDEEIKGIAEAVLDSLFDVIDYLDRL